MTKPRPMPEDFRTAYETMSIIALKKHYSASHDAVRRWIAEAGLGRQSGYHGQIKSKAQAPVASAVKIKPHQPNNPASATRTMRDMSAAGQAADVLRRDRWVVFRADENRRQSATGQFWVCGRALLTSAELIERAERAERRMAA